MGLKAEHGRAAAPVVKPRDFSASAYIIVRLHACMCGREREMRWGATRLASLA